ncbi:YuzF family protein [Halobacillus shinanisalinarum]|uniref:YuzF family protein n=1 Tax=Halobacillus shinanisalinarum TaxID=2932258 RepID=A0ABY4H1B7_9BACI|nr:DUF2642 domain-containing protein [Halobacillus shinanisalinarum]UOQ94226.1 YuzF family protein [Halobacillus shinanisalinarum]
MTGTMLLVYTITGTVKGRLGAVNNDHIWMGIKDAVYVIQIQDIIHFRKE